MDSDLCGEQEVPSAVLTGINFSVSVDKEKVCLEKICVASEVTDPKLGLPNPSSECLTCGAKDLKHCEGHFGVIQFPYTILHPYYLSEVVQILNKVCPACKSLREDLWIKGPDSLSIDQPKGCKYCVGNSLNWYPPMKFKVLSEDIFRLSAIMVEVNENVLRKFQKRRKEALPADYWDFLPKDSHQEESGTRPNRRILSHAQVHFLLKAIDPKLIRKFILRPDSLFLNYFPVTPNSHRVTELTYMFSSGQRLFFDERTGAYKKLVDFRGTSNELSSRVLGCLKISKLHTFKSSSKDATTALLKNEDSSNMVGLRYMKDVLLGKRNDSSFRTVVIGDRSLKLSEIGIPCHIAESLQISENLNNWNWDKLISSCDLRLLEKGEIHVRRKNSLISLRRISDLRMGDIISRPLKDGDILLINRPPSIHPHSLIALSVKVLPISSVVSINPICCSPFRGDFDGDCFHGYIPQSIEARVELHELVALDRQLTNWLSGRNLLCLGQDSLTAAHLIKEDGFLLNKYQMQQLKMYCPYELPPPALVKAPRLNSSVWTGKQLFSMLLPPGFNYYFSQNGVCIINGELTSSSDGSAWLRDNDGNLFQSLVKYDKSMVLNFLYAAQEVLCDWLSDRGFSISLSDLYLSSDLHSRENLMDEISWGLLEAEQTCNFKQLMVDSCRDLLAGNDEESQNVITFDVERLCYEKQGSAVLSQASVDAFKQVFRDIQTLAFKYASKENSLLAMYKAGSKGSLPKLVQHSMCLGLQHSLVPLSFRFPHQLSCAAWNKQKRCSGLMGEIDGNACLTKSFIPYAVVKNSFSTGLNPLECFVHSVTSRGSSFSDNADLPGTLTRRLMFFMRDLYRAYDGTIRSAYGNQLVQFSYNTDEGTSTSNCSLAQLTRGSVNPFEGIGGEPVGSLSACAISEAAYSALDQPISLLETSPLLNLKNIMECGLRKSSSNQTVSLFLSEKLGRHRHGFEYGALEVKNHLERLNFSEIVSTAMIIFSPQTLSEAPLSAWVCHFHVRKALAKRRRLKEQLIVGSLYRWYNNAKKELKVNISDLLITSKECPIDDGPRQEDSFCISVTVVKKSKDSSVQLDTVRGLVMPFLLRAVIKGFPEIKKVDILWKDRPKLSKSYDSRGELYLRVSMSEEHGTRTSWNALMDDCLPIMDMIDWARSYPDNIHHFCSANGIDAGWKLFLNNLDSAISDVGKTILPEHLLLIANCLSATGEFVGLSSRGLAQQRKHASVVSPFTQACFSNPSTCFVKAAKAGVTDDLQGSIDALAWGKPPCFGTGGQFDIIYSWRDKELYQPVDVYDLLNSIVTPLKQNVKSDLPNSMNIKSDKYGDRSIYVHSGSISLGLKKLEGISRAYLRTVLTWKDIQKLYHASKKILNKYPIDHRLNEGEKKILMMALYFHPQSYEKIGTGAQYIKIGYHPEYKGTRCFHLVRTDGTTEDFSYRKCVLAALDSIAPEKAKLYRSKWLEQQDYE